MHFIYTPQGQTNPISLMKLSPTVERNGTNVKQREKLTLYRYSIAGKCINAIQRTFSARNKKIFQRQIKNSNSKQIRSKIQHKSG